MRCSFLQALPVAREHDLLAEHVLLAWDDGGEDPRHICAPDGAGVSKSSCAFHPCRVHLSVEAAAAVRSTSFAHAVEELCLAAEAMYSTRGVEGRCC